MNVTRDVVADLWPLYADGSASADSRAIVEAFLRTDPEWGRRLQQTIPAGPPPPGQLPTPQLMPDQEVKMLNRIKLRVRIVRWLFFFSMLFTFQAFGRIVQDTQWVASPKRFISTAVVAAICWLAYLIAALRVRRLGP